jgi:hypothetical protein
MAETLISPGTLARENDQSQITSQPVQVGAAIVGPTVKGRKNIPTLVTSYSEYAATFGTTFDSGSDQYTFLTSISAYNYFKNGGDSLLVTRVASGSFSSATSTNISGSGTTTTAFTLETLGEGVILNCSLSESSGGALISGSADNFRWEITNPSTSSGTFSLIIRRGNDKTKTKSVLETFNNVSLDPKSSNYIARIVGDQKVNLMGSGTDLYLQSTGSYPNASRFVRVSAVNAPTPDFFDNAGVAKNDYTSSIPVAASGSFTGAEGSILTGTGKYYDNISSTDTQGL